MQQLLTVIIIFCLVIAPVAENFAQPKPEYTSKNKKAISSYEKGLKYFESGNSPEAIKAISKAISEDENFIEAHNLLGTLYYDEGEYEKSATEYKRSLGINPEYNVKLYHFLAISELKAGNYSAAADHFRIFLSKPGISKNLQAEAEKLLKSADFGAWAIQHPVPFNPQNLGVKINSVLNEYFPTISTDGKTLIFTRKIPKKGSFDNIDEDFFVSEKNVSDNWSDAYPMGPPVNTEYREGAKCLSADERTLYYTACERPDGKGSCDLYYSRKTGGKWGPSQNMGFPVNSSKWESQPTLSSDGKALYFASGRSGGKGGKDIWQSTLNEDGAWSTPISMDINTEGDDESPFIHPDNQTLYFCSDGYPGMGNSDVYFTKKNKEGKFETPVNLGYPINTLADEYSIFVSLDGEVAFFSSDRTDGNGGLDIYSFELYPEARPLRVTYTKGFVYDAKTNKKLNAKIELIDLESRQTILEAVSGSDNGSFLVCLPVNKNYALNVSKEGYLFFSENFSLKERKDYKPYPLEVALEPIEIGNKVVLKNIFFETGKFDLKEESKAELNKLVSFVKLNAKIKIEISGHTDNVGGKESNQLLSENRAKSVYAYLLLQGIAAPRLTYKGYGDSQPICPPNDTDDCRASNRRTEFKVIGK